MALAWEDREGIPLLVWHGPPGVVAAFTSRVGGVSTGPFASLNLGLTTGDDRAAVGENRRRLCAAVGADPARTAQNHQVHGAAVRGAEPLPGGYLDPQGALPQADALVTREAGLALVALSADCVPIVVATADGAALGVVHAGWKGLVAGVVEAAVAALGPGPKAAAIGPCAGPGAYEVGEDVAVPLRERFGAPAAARTADLPFCATAALVAAGVAPDAVDVAGACTISDSARFFSHRREGAATGRQGLIAYREGRDGA